MIPQHTKASHRIESVQAPIIPIVAEWIRLNPGTLSLGQGVVHYPPPPAVADGIQQFMADARNHRYKAVNGIPELLDALQQKLLLENHTSVGPDRRIVVTAGSNLAFVNTLLAIADPGDEIILLVPYYFNHEMAIQMLGCRAVLVPTDADYQPDLDRIQSSITPRTRAIVTVSPNNPSGAVYSEQDLRAINALCANRGLYHISDEAYEYFTYDQTTHFSPASIPGSEGHTISLYSLSKSCGFASWRIGYQLIPSGLFEAILKIQDTQLICAPVISQFAAVQAVPIARSYCSHHLASIRTNRDIFLGSLSDLGDRVSIPTSAGAFYLLLRLKTSQSSLKVAQSLVENHKVAVIPGVAFGVTTPCLLRVAYAALNREEAVEGVRRLKAGLPGF